VPSFEHGDASIYYEEFGSGYPVLLFAPGGLRSAVDLWHRSTWDPTVELAGSFRVIAMDQRNAGRSHAPVRADDGWHTYTADQVALLDHLDIETAHVMGMCIGGPFCLGIIKAIPERITAAVLQQPSGLSATNRADFLANSLPWVEQIKQEQPNLDDATIDSFRQNMYGGVNFAFTVSEEFVRTISTPLLVLAGNDNFHPLQVSQKIAELAPNAELILSWKELAAVPEAVRRVRAFLESHTPVRA
jgi:pimeloyl-ACP methyl ester carboxylesterase